MQLGSTGVAGLQAARQTLYRTVNHNPARNIHLSARNTRISAGRRFIAQSRHFLAKFVGQLTAPGIGSQAATSYHTAGRSTIQQRLTLPVRSALARPTFLPRPPAVPRSVAQVGLGSARNFSSARPIFQNLVENIPVAGRAFCEADVDIKSRKKTAAKGLKATKSSKGKKAPAFGKVSTRQVPAVQTGSEAVSELDHYFPSSAASITTCLHIPLAPTPTERVPLPANIQEHGSLLPLPTLASIHTSHEMHALRVSSLFSRLDSADVWDKGVQCSAYSHLGDGQGVCTILKVEFVGWTMAEVRAVLGESGTGWCALEEIQTPDSLASVRNDEFAYDSDLSETSSISSGVMEGIDESFCQQSSTDPSASFVLPTLDFSSSFTNAIYSAPSTPPVLSRSPSDSSLSLSDLDYMSDHSSEPVVIEPSQSVEFSAAFMGQREGREERGPMEVLF